MATVIEQLISDEDRAILLSRVGNAHEGRRIEIYNAIEAQAAVSGSEYTDAVIAELKDIVTKEHVTTNFWYAIARLAPHASDPGVAADILLANPPQYIDQSYIKALTMLVDGVSYLASMVDQAISDLNNPAYDETRLNWLHLWLQNEPNCFKDADGLIPVYALVLKLVEEQKAQNVAGKGEYGMPDCDGALLGSSAADFVNNVISKEKGVLTDKFALPNRVKLGLVQADFIEALCIVRENYNPSISFATATYATHSGLTTRPLPGQTQTHYKLTFSRGN